MKYLWLLLVLILVPLVSAIPEIPHQFYGTVSNDDGLLNSGILTAKLCDVDFNTQIVNGDYGLNEPFLVSREDCSETNIEFYVSDYKGGNYVYESGAFTELDFKIPGSNPPENPPDGGGSSGGGGTTLCTENWECSAWGECLDQKQTRTCVDVNDCGTTNNKPELEQTCVVETGNKESSEEVENEEGKESSVSFGNEEETKGIIGIVGAVIGGGVSSLKWIVVTIVSSLVVVVGLGVLFYKWDDIQIWLLRRRLGL